MERKERDGSIEKLVGDWEQNGDWVAEQLRLNVQLWAVDAETLVNHFPSYAAIFAEMFFEYQRFSETLSTYWELSQQERTQLKEFQRFLDTFDDGFWSIDALFTDSRWNELRSFAKKVLATFQWPIEVPLPEPGSRASSS